MTTASESADAQLEVLLANCVTVERTDELRAKLVRSQGTGKPLIVKAGFDPSAPDIHLGHLLPMRKMRAFQDLGHEVHFVVGDFTGMIGDPSGKSKTRPQLTPEQIKANAATYAAQAFKVLRAEATRIDFNATWLTPLGADGFVRLAAKATVAQMLERADFKARLEKGIPISVHEFLYPLCQAYDSVALVADVELGGTDQTWNLLMGRDIMREYGQEPQIVMTVPLLEGLDGSEKMSKSLGNAVGITEPPAEMFGKLMSISDELMWRYRKLLTSDSPAAIEAARHEVAHGGLHPMEAKKGLAERLVADFHGADAGRAARTAFEEQFQRRQAPSDVPEASIARDALPLELVTLMAEHRLASSKSDARRLIAQGAVELDGVRVTDVKHPLAPDAPATLLLKVGKRSFLRLRIMA